uniref:DUF7812 domain-containing protein n=1 Tax=Kalanchoe fedtschenkoi TaxID=63787 RepID=A0A7N0U9D1_KALFE
MVRKKLRRENSASTPRPRNLRTLIDAIRNPEGFKLPLLKSLYGLLVQLSIHRSDSFSSSTLLYGKLGLGLSSTNLIDLLDALFTELDKRFQQLFSALCNASSLSAIQISQMFSSSCATSKEFTLLLRCCLVVIMLPQLDQQLVLDKGIFLISALKRLCSLDVVGVDISDIKFMKSSSHNCSINGLTSSIAEEFVAFFSFVKPSHLCLPLLCALLEVFADEILIHESLKENLMLFDSLSSSDTDRLFVSSSHGDVRNVMELIACHFILSFSDEKVCDSILDRLYWHNRMDKRVPELGMNQCVLLLLDSTFLSAPAIFQSHLILMASEAIGIDSAFTSAAPDVRLNNCYLLAFERSVILYTRHIYDLHIDGDSLGILRPDSCVQRNMLRPDFDLFIRPTTRYHVDRLLSKLDDYWDYWKKNITLRTKSELLSISFTYIEEHQRLFFGACKEKMLSFIRALITVASEEVTDFISYEKVHASLPHLFLTASILKSMNASLLQALRCLEKRSKVGNLKLLKDFLDGKEYDFIVHVISSFEKLNECLPVPRHPSIHDLLQGSKTKHTESKQMLLHFYGFLALGFRYKLEFLVKSCIFTLMTLMNLVIFEDGHLDALHPVLAYLSGYSADLFLGKLDEVLCSFPLFVRKSLYSFENS